MSAGTYKIVEARQGRTYKIPLGWCQCGCGQRTRVPKWSSKRDGQVAGRPLLYVHAHQSHSPMRWVEEDRGYKTPCWIWQLKVNENGYGRSTRACRSIQAHWETWEVLHGPVPDGMHLDHLCFVPACVNPDHLEVVTPLENVRRQRNTKLSPEAVAEIRASAERGVDLARRFGVSPATICDVQKGRSWTKEAA